MPKSWVDKQLDDPQVLRAAFDELMNENAAIRAGLAELIDDWVEQAVFDFGHGQPKTAYVYRECARAVRVVLE